MTGKKHELYVERRSEGDYAVRRGGLRTRLRYCANAKTGD